MRSLFPLAVLVGVVVAGTSRVPRGGSAPKSASAIVEGTGTDTTKWRCRVVAGPLPGSVAEAVYSDDVDTDGWAKLQITALGHGVVPARAAFGAGCLEAYFTHTRMYQYWYNYARANYAPSFDPPAKLVGFMTKQKAWIRSKLAAAALATNTTTATTAMPAADSDRVPAPPPATEAKFWTGMGLLMAQFDGLASGFATYGSGSERKLLTPMNVYLLNSVGDLETLNGLMADVAVDSANASGPFPPQPEVPIGQLDCSALVALVGVNVTSADGNNAATKTAEDVFFGHTTWRSYYAMLRVYKTYELGYLPQQQVSLSSSPGLLHSKDDFYATPQLAVMETTNGIYNQSLYTNATITPQSAMSWQRAMVATGFAADAKDWVDLFSLWNSGTYNNQWMVLDSGKFDPSAALPAADLFWVAEQIPGKIVSADMTATLTGQGFWPSYNIPFFKEIFDLSGYPSEVKRHGPSATYAKAPRALIFAREAPKVKAMAGFKKLMRYNDYETDPVCQKAGYGGGACAISARGDLGHAGGWVGGGVDSKVVAVSDMRTVHAASGPTHNQQTVFSWNRPAFSKISHIGLPETFDFDYVEMTGLGMPSVVEI